MVIEDTSASECNIHKSMQSRDRKQRDRRRSRDSPEEANANKAGNPPVCFIPISCMEGNMFSKINDLPGGFGEFVNNNQNQSEPSVCGPYVPILYFAPLSQAESKTNNKESNNKDKAYQKQAPCNKPSRIIHPRRCEEEAGDRRRSPDNNNKFYDYEQGMEWDNEGEDAFHKGRFSSGCSSIMEKNLKKSFNTSANHSLKSSTYPRNDLKPVLTRESICMGANVKKCKRSKKQQSRAKQEEQFSEIKSAADSTFKAGSNYTEEPRSRYNDQSKSRKEADAKSKLPNFMFYTNQSGQGDSVETILKELESNPRMFDNISIIYKLFPNNQLLSESPDTVPLTNKEKILLTTNESFRSRYMSAYCHLLKYYGMELVNGNTDVQRGPNAMDYYKQTMGNNSHHRKAIEIVIKSLCALGYDDYALSWIIFLMKEVMLHKKFLPTQKTVKAIQEVWIKSLNKETHRSMAFDLFRRYFKEGKIEEKINESRRQGLPMTTGGYRYEDMSY